VNRWSNGAWTALAEMGDRLAGIVPGLLAMVILLLVGVIAGWLARRVVRGAARVVGLDRHMERWGVGPSLRRSAIFVTPVDLLATVAFWAVFVVFASLGIDALGVPGSPGAAAFLVSFIPPLFAAVLVLLVGILVASFLSQGLLIAAVNAGVPEARLLARAVHWGVLLFAVATALTGLGIGKEMVLVAFGITFGGLVFALALAFGLGGRSIAREILERRLHRESPPPQERLTHL
jgi:mechanosensitive ion channel-like protein